VNEKNSGSTFRQWVKGISLASGDLIWIAESDDACRPDFLERLVPAFSDPEVVLAYSQSAIIGPRGKIEQPDYHFYTDSISSTRWHSPYTVTGLEEIELALCQMNTIPNASAVVFRRPAQLDFASELETLRLAGDWLFYAMQLRRGKIAFLPDALNYHRRHQKTVRHAFEREAALFEERIYVKMRIFEEFPISTNSVSRSLGCSIREYWDRVQERDRREPGLVHHPRLARSIERIRAAFDQRVSSPAGPRILMVIGDMDPEGGQEDVIRLANAMAEHHPVYLCSARPARFRAPEAARIDSRVVLIEGTLGHAPWSHRQDLDLDQLDAVPERRADVLRELIEFHRIDFIYSAGWWANRLVHEVRQGLNVPWFIDLRSLAAVPANDLKFNLPIAPMMSNVRGAFYARSDDLRMFAGGAIPRPRRLIRIDDGLEVAGGGPAARGLRRPGDLHRSSDDLAGMVTKALFAACDTTKLTERF